jgi:hypothetical protein
MSVADWLFGRKSQAAMLPGRIEELRGPARGTIVLPPHMSLPGLRECDVTDDATRRTMYGIVLTQGQRNDMARYVNADLLRADWPHIRQTLDSRLRWTCERRFGLGDDIGAVTDQPAEA